MMSLFKNRIFASCFVLAWFWIWAFHTATGLFDFLIAGPGLRRSFLLGTLQDVTEAILVDPLGRPIAVIILILLGIGGAALVLKFMKYKEVT